MAEATTAKKSPNGHAALRRGAVAERVTKLREFARSDPEAAREQAWSWITELGERARADRAGALAELQELFLCGQPAEGINGQTEGRLVTWSLHPVVDNAIGALTDAWMPWLGKRFDPERRRGANTLAAGARWPMKLLWPLYETQPSPLGRTGFEFTTYVEAGRLDPSVDVLVIDYGSVPSNPKLVIRQIRDELVQIVAGANLGKMLVNVPGRSDPLLGLYFALRSEI
jgi:hypothetical protein